MWNPQQVQTLVLPGTCSACGLELVSHSVCLCRKLMFEHQARKMSGHYEQYRPRLHHEQIVEKEAVAACHQRKMEEHMRSAEHRWNWLQIVQQHSNRLQEQVEQGVDTHAQIAALYAVTQQEEKRLLAAMGELTCLLEPPCVAPMAVLCSCFLWGTSLCSCDGSAVFPRSAALHCCPSHGWHAQ